MPPLPRDWLIGYFRLYPFARGLRQEAPYPDAATLQQAVAIARRLALVCDDGRPRV